jgi:hypothetical protein
MKRTTVILILITISFIGQAQSSNSRISEIGLNVSLSNMYGIRFKTGNEKLLLRTTLQSLTGQTLKTANGNKSTLFGCELNLGIEKRIPISDNVTFYFGSDLITGVTKINQQSQLATDLVYSAGVGLVLGFNYNINNQISISAEIMPSIIYSKDKETISNPVNGEKTVSYSHNLTYGFNGSNSTLGSIVFNGVNNYLANFTISFRIGNKAK